MKRGLQKVMKVMEVMKVMKVMKRGLHILQKFQKGICYEQLRVNKFGNLYEMDKFLGKKEVEKGSLSM